MSVNQTLIQPSISIDDVTKDQIDYSWNTMPGNQPQTNSNTLFLWQTASLQVPTGDKPLQTHTVGSNNEQGSDTFGDLSVGVTAYLIGYAVGTDVANVCMLVLIPAVSDAADKATTAIPKISFKTVGATSISYSYAMPEGTQPASDGDWVGLWQGVGEAVLYATPPFAQQQVNSSSNTGDGSFTNITVERGTEYTLGYFKGGWSAKTAPNQATLACASSFGG